MTNHVFVELPEKINAKDYRILGNWLAPKAPLALRHYLAIALLFYIYNFM